jgi:hypothetical protein
VSRGWVSNLQGVLALPGTATRVMVQQMCVCKGAPCWQWVSLDGADRAVSGLRDTLALVTQVQVQTCGLVTHAAAPYKCNTLVCFRHVTALRLNLDRRAQFNLLQLRIVEAMMQKAAHCRHVSSSTGLAARHTAPSLLIGCRCRQQRGRSRVSVHAHQLMHNMSRIDRWACF